MKKLGLLFQWHVGKDYGLWNSYEKPEKPALRGRV